MNLSTCALCSSTIDSSNSIYRAFDNTYCSKACLRDKCFSINIIDPEHIVPSIWHKSQSQSTINISEDIEKPNEESNEESNEVISTNFSTNNMSKLSLTQYSYLIASTFGIEGIKKVLSNSHPMPILL